MNVQTFVEINKTTLLSRINSEHSAMWRDSSLSVLTEKALEVLELSRNMLSKNKDLDFNRSYVKPSQFAPSKIFKSKFELLFPNLTIEEMVDCMTEPNLCPKLDFALPVNIAIVNSLWSPIDLVYNNKRVVAVLTNVGAVDLVAQQRSNWVSLYNLSNKILKHYSAIWKKNNLTENFDLIKRCCSDLETSAMAWSSLNKTKISTSCYLVTGQRNSDILFWLVESDIRKSENEFKVELKSSVESNIGVINSMYWITLNHCDTSFLVCAGQNGQVTIHALKVSKDDVSISSSQMLWSDVDYIVTDGLLYFERSHKLIICFVKGAHLIIVLLDYSLNIICTRIENMGGSKVTCCTKLKNDSIILGTYGLIKQVIIKCHEKELTVEINKINFKYDFSTWAIMGICCSQNEAIWALTLNRRRIDQTKSKVKALVLYLQIENLNYFEKIFDNPSQKLTHLWDFIELARVTAHRNKKIPIEEFKNKFINVINSTPYDLRVYLLINTIYDCLIQNNAHREDIATMFIVSKEEALDTIICHHAVSRIRELDSINDLKGLDEFQLESLQSAYGFLRDYCRVNKKEIINFINYNIIEKFGNAIDANKKLTCEFCGEDLEKYMCKNNHCMQWCILSFVPVSDDYLLCPVCGASARTDLYSSKAMCIICDSYMEKSFT